MKHDPPLMFHRSLSPWRTQPRVLIIGRVCAALIIGLCLSSFYPLNAQDQPAPEITRVGDTSTVRWHGVAGRTYFVQLSKDLAHWQFLPVIESGHGASLEYTFESPVARHFARLCYTDAATGDPLNDDFDGDSISNWNEIRAGGTATSPFLFDSNGDSDGKYQSDYFNDTDQNQLYDGWEVRYFSAPGVVNPHADADGDSLSNFEESLMGSNPNQRDTDGDTVDDNQDSVWWDDRLTWPRSKESRYLVIELEGLELNALFYDHALNEYDRNLQRFQPGELFETQASEWGVVALSNAGHVLVQEDLRHPSEIDRSDDFPYNTGGLIPGNIRDSIRNYVWSPTMGTWNKLDSDTLENGQTVMAVATDVSASGAAIGYAWVPLKDQQGFPTQVDKTVVKWPGIDDGQQAQTLTPLSMLGQVHTSFTDLQTAAPTTHNYPSLYLDERGTVLNLKWVFDSRTRSGDTFNFDMEQNRFLFKANDQGAGQVVADGFSSAGAFRASARVIHRDDPANIDVVGFNQDYWARTKNAWGKIKPHPVVPIPAGIGVSQDFTVLLNSGKDIMRNGKVIPIRSLVTDSAWSDFRMSRMNDRGMMAGRATKDGAEKIVLLVPVEILVPAIENDEDTGGLKSSTRVRVAKIYRGLSKTVFGSTHVDIPIWDHDRFYVRVPKFEGLKVKLSTLITPFDFDGRVFDDANEIEMVVDPDDPNYLISKPQLLVSSDVDDDAATGGLRVDDVKHDNTHKTNGTGPVLLSISIGGKDVGEVKWNTRLQHFAAMDQVVIIPDADGTVAIEADAFDTFFDVNIKPHFRQVDVLLGLGQVSEAEDRPNGMTTETGALIKIGQSPIDVFQPVIDAYGTEAQDDIQAFVFTSLKQESLIPVTGGFQIKERVFALSIGVSEDPKSKFANTMFFQTNHIHPTYMQSEDGVVAAHELAHILTAGDHYEGDWKRHNILYRDASLNQPTNVAYPEFFQSRRFTQGQEESMHANPLVSGPNGADNSK